MRRVGPWIGLLALMVLSGCLGRAWETSYLDLVTRSTTKSWNLVDIQVQVPQELTVSEANFLAPRADIVWWGEPIGDRRAQVRDIIENAGQNISHYLNGSYSVRMEVEVEQFHALTERARRLAPSAVHNLQFKVRVFDAKSGQQIVPTDRIRADFPAYTRSQASAAVSILGTALSSYCHRSMVVICNYTD